MACCSKKTIGAGLAVAVFTWAFDFLVNGVLFADLYEANKAIFRPETEMMNYMPWCIAYHIVMGLLVAGAYICWRKKTTVGAVGSSECPYRKSLGFGLWVGLLLGIPQLMVFVWTPIAIELPLLWAANELVKWTLAGILLNCTVKAPTA
jgi:hypothetical protein